MTTSRLDPMRRRVLLAAAALALIGAGACGGRRTATTTVSTEPVARRDIVVAVEATGTVEPIDLVEVKSKASGQIVRMPVEIGSHVERGALLAQIDTRDVQNAFDQARAALVAAQARVQVTRAQKKRSDELFAEQVITAAEHEAAMLENANAQAQLVKARTDLDLARQRLEDARVAAPIAGVVLEKPVSAGQVISSATSSVSGGTTLLKMADLSRIRVRALVGETDIGKVRPGQEAAVVVDAHPQRPFRGLVEKIEPQAVVEQSVTMFPVLVSIENEQGLLMPGMNGEVTVTVGEAQGVLAVPVDALRNVREVAAVAKSLGLDPEQVTADVQAQTQALAAAAAAAGDSAGGRMPAGTGAGAEALPAASEGRSGGTAAMAGRDGGSPGGGGPRRFRGAGGAGGDSARRAWRQQRGEGGAGPGEGAGGAPGVGGGPAAGGGMPGARMRRGAAGGEGMQRGVAGGAGSGGAAARSGLGGARAGGAMGGMGGAGGMGGRRQRAQVVVVRTEKGYEPRVVRVGLSNYDYAQVVQGVEEGEEVVLLSVVDLQQQRTETMDRIRSRMGGGIPGSGGGTAPRSSGGSGGGPGGGGGR